MARAFDEPAPVVARRGFRPSQLQSPEWTTLIVLLLVVAGLSLRRPDFLQRQNIVDILINAAYITVAATGMTMIIISGAIDISVGAIIGVCAIVAGTAAKAGWPMVAVVLITVLAGGVMGLFNGWLVAKLKIPAIIVTLGMLSVYRGGMIWFTRGVWIRNLPESFYLSQRALLGIPAPIWIMVVTVIVFAYLLRNTVFGRYIYAVGGNHDAARLAGVPVERIQLAVFLLNGLLIGLAAIVLATRFSVIQSNTGIGFELVVITAAVVGGTSILGGSGTIIGTFLAVLLLQVLGTGMTFLRISPYWFQTVQGLMILLAVVADIVRRRRAQTV